LVFRLLLPALQCIHLRLKASSTPQQCCQLTLQAHPRGPCCVCQALGLCEQGTGGTQTGLQATFQLGLKFIQAGLQGLKHTRLHCCCCCCCRSSVGVDALGGVLCGILAKVLSVLLLMLWVLLVLVVSTWSCCCCCCCCWRLPSIPLGCQQAQLLCQLLAARLPLAAAPLLLCCCCLQLLQHCRGHTDASTSC
jgi:hypothetical protein